MPNNEGTAPVPAAKLMAGIVRNARVSREIKAFLGKFITLYLSKNLEFSGLLSVGAAFFLKAQK
jgi:hypothetical protein